MTAGDMAIYREATAGESLDNAAFTNVDYDTEVREDTDSFDLVSGNDEVDLLDLGHHLVLFNESIDVTSGTRSTMYGQVAVGGADTAIRGSGYSRNTQGCTEAYVAGSGIVNTASDGQDISTQIRRNSTVSQTILRRANLGGLQILKLNDDWDYFIAKSDTAINVLTLGDEIVWENVEEEDAGSFDLQANEFDIEVQAGYYLCCYTVSFACTTTGVLARCGGIAYLLLDGTEVEGSRSMNYGRLSDGCAGAVISCICVFESASVQNLKLQTTVSNRTGGGQIADANTSIQIVKLPDDTLKKAWVYDGTGGYTIADAGLTDIPMDDEIDVDTDIFTHSTVSSTDDITVDVDGDYLFMYGMYAGENGHTGTTSYRYNILCRFQDGGTPMMYGNSGNYYRGYASATSYIQNCGSSHGIIFDSLSANDDINIAAMRESDETTFPPTTNAPQTAVSAIQLSSIFPVSDTEPGSYWYAQQGF